MNCRTFYRVAFALVFFIPASIFAEEFDYILGDLDRFEEEANWYIQAEIRAMEDDAFQESEDLFPVVKNKTERTPGLANAQDFLSVKVDGIPVTFSDVPIGEWFAPYVRSAAEASIVSGYRDANGRILGSFGPGDDVTIEQLAKMALQAAGATVKDCAGVPKNLTASGSWSAHYVACAEGMGWAVYSDGSVNVERSATRSEVVVTLLQAFDVPFGRGTGEVFTDVTASTEFSGAIELAAEDGMVAGYADENGDSTGVFGAANSVNRAEVAKMVTLAKSLYGN